LNAKHGSSRHDEIPGRRPTVDDHHDGKKLGTTHVATSRHVKRIIDGEKGSDRFAETTSPGGRSQGSESAAVSATHSTLSESHSRPELLRRLREPPVELGAQAEKSCHSALCFDTVGPSQTDTTRCAEPGTQSHVLRQSAMNNRREVMFLPNDSCSNSLSRTSSDG